PPTGNGFNNYGWGGFLIWSFPEAPTFIDGRMDTWKKNDAGILSEYKTVWELKPGWENIFRKYNIGWVLTEPDSPLAGGLKLHPEWQIVFEDKTSVIFNKIDSFYFLTKNHAGS
ncbi:MAG: hypothetical protein Q8N98_04680, partial [bacterium]|nr:hypothetical protein [bacterium]